MNQFTMLPVAIVLFLLTVLVATDETEFRPDNHDTAG
jgi:hypothetical protein